MILPVLTGSRSGGNEKGTPRPSLQGSKGLIDSFEKTLLFTALAKRNAQQGLGERV
jgi:hypothetical protein